jgi:hypothetical protein
MRKTERDADMGKGKGKIMEQKREKKGREIM